MGIFDVHRTIKEKAEAGQPLPENLSTRDIALLWSDDSRQQDLLTAVMARAIESRRLKIQSSRDYSSVYVNDCGRVFVTWIYDQGESGAYATSAEIHKDDFLDWLESEGEPSPTDCLLVNWWGESQLLVDRESTDQTAVHAIGYKLLAMYKDHPVPMTCRHAKKLPELRIYYDRYPGNDPVKVDKWLKETLMPAGKPGRASKEENAFIPSLD